MDILTQLTSICKATTKAEAASRPQLNRGCRPELLYEAMDDDTVWTSSKVVEHFNWSRSTANMTLLRLHKLGLIEKVGERVVGPNAMYLYRRPQ